MINNMEFKSIQQYFPKSPYTIQIKIAKTIHKALKESKKVVIIESPTGTGKTYSLLVPIIAWLIQNKCNIGQKEQQSSTKVPSWLKKPTQQKGQNLLKQVQKSIEQMIYISEAKEHIKCKKKLIIQQKRQKQSKEKVQQDQIEINSEQQDNIKNGKRFMNQQQRIVEMQLHTEDPYILPKLIFVSRTHSQLSQVMDSLKEINSKDELKYLQLASKQQLCINKAVNDNKSSINQKCQHLMDHGHCPYFHQLDIKQFFNTNIEKTLELGTSHELCPYYAARSILKYANVICLPYSSILSKDIRNKLGVNLHNSIIVFDEGHNLLDYEKQMHSPEVKVDDFEVLASQIDQYLQTYGDRLKIKNQRILCHLLEIVRSFASTILGCVEQSKTNCPKKYIKMMYIQFFLKLKLKELNIHKIKKYIQLNSIDKKLAYFNAKGQLKQKQFIPNKLTPATVNRIIQFLLQFVNFDVQTEVLMLKWNEHARGSIKIMCLQSREVGKIIEESRMTIIAGGTMEPLDELIMLTDEWRHKTIIQKISAYYQIRSMVLTLKKFISIIRLSHNKIHFPYLKIVAQKL